YLAEQVYEALTAEERDVLHFAAYLPVIDAETLKHGGIANGKAVLEALRARVAFIYHERPGVYYCHDLFRDFLNHQLEMQGDDAVAGMLARVGGALEAAGRSASALTAYAKAGAASDILRLLEREGFDLVDRAHGDAVQAAVGVLGESVRAGSPVVLGMRAMNEAALGRFDRAESLFERALAKTSDRELSARLAIPLALVRYNQGRSASALLAPLADDEEMPVGLRAEMYALMAGSDAYLGSADGVAGHIRNAERCVNLVDDEATRAKVYQRLGVASMHLGDVTGARERLTAAADLAGASGLLSLAARTYNALANVTMVHEEASPARVVWYAQQAVASATKAADRLALQTALIQMLDVEEYRGSIDRMRSILGQLAEATTSDPVRSAIIVEGNSWLAAAEGRFEEAYRLLAPLAERVVDEEDRILNGVLVALYALTLGKRGEGLDRVQRALQQIASFVPATSRAALRVEIARSLGGLVEALAGRGGAAGRTLAREASEAPPAARMFRRAVLCLVRALKTPAAGAELTEALEALRSAGYGGYTRLLDLLHARYLAASQPAPSALTRAELAMFQGLAAGKSPKEIAVESGRSVYTVQTHIRNAIAKLGCSGRAEALVFARHSGLIA
ncbi:MAG: LuxR C-terminal-related transcriptional regulator, partial [Vulcanimicrobiaceae bacterium]